MDIACHQYPNTTKGVDGLMKRFIVSSIGSILALVLLQSPAIAVTTTFFGEDQGLGELTPLSSFPNATAARNNFLSNLVGVAAELSKLDNSCQSGIPFFHWLSVVCNIE
jgi:hypothetical protein